MNRSRPLHGPRASCRLLPGGDWARDRPERVPASRPERSTDPPRLPSARFQRLCAGFAAIVCFDGRFATGPDPFSRNQATPARRRGGASLRARIRSVLRPGAA